MNRMRDHLKQTKQHGPRRPNRKTQEDFYLWSKILESVSTRGIDINNITFTMPTTTTYSNACEHGIGGYNTNGLAWRLQLPPNMIGRLLINVLEFAAAAITIYLTVESSTSPQKVLAYTDSSSALGWLYKASYSSSQPIHDKIARWLAKCLITNDSALYSQHIPGKYNVIADSLCLSRHTHTNQIPHLCISQSLTRTNSGRF